jgi:hypothetical protein
MGLIEGDVVAAAAATAAVLSPRARKLARKGAVFGIAGALKAGDVVASAARGVVRGAQSAMSTQQPTARPPSAAKRSPSHSAPSGRGRARSGADSTRAAS